MDRFRTALVLGLGGSGEAAADLLLSESVRVTVVDSGDTGPVRARGRALADRGAVVRTGSGLLPDAGEGNEFDVCVVSPGVRADSDWIRQVRQRGVALISEIELGARRCECPLLAVTGTNGKSTMVKLCAQAIAAAGRRCEVAGNYGPPLSSAARGSRDLDWLVVEVSSFQLEWVDRFRPRVGVLLNLQPDHLDRHADAREYGALKARLFERMGSGDTAVVPEPGAGGSVPIGPGPRQVTFGSSARADFRYRDGNLEDLRGKCDPVSLRGTPFENPVMGLTAAAAAAALDACGVGLEHLDSAASSFVPLPHRMNNVSVPGPIRFVDDSKATNLAALAAALDMTPGPVRLIAGGLLKENNLECVKERLANKVRRTYLIGTAAEAMQAAWRDTVPCTRCEGLEAAVSEARRDSEAGETVLLSPGCASFDEFEDFADRGNRFVGIVRAISEETGQ